jgi:hypothetical protein
MATRTTPVPRPPPPPTGTPKGPVRDHRDKGGGKIDGPGGGGKQGRNQLLPDGLSSPATKKPVVKKAAPK